MTNLYLIRHGETEWNVSGQHQGHLDSPLTGNGVHQAERLGERMARCGWKFDAIYTSDLGRAMQTASILSSAIGQADLVRPEPQLRERALGVLQGLTYPEIEERLPADFALHTSGDPHYRPNGGESWADTFARACHCLRGIARKHRGQTVLCVAHGGILGMMMRDCLKISVGEKRRFHIPNCALNIFEWGDEAWVLRTWADTAHMEGQSVRDEIF